MSEAAIECEGDKRRRVQHSARVRYTCLSRTQVTSRSSKLPRIIDKMASQPSTSSGPTNPESPEYKRAAFAATYAGENIGVESSMEASSSAKMTSFIASSITGDAISV
eukprot:8941750-Heterocapsa_arctica.AAC.1